MAELQGIFPALVTPVDNEGQFNEEAYKQLLARIYRAGAHGVYVCGQTGEGFQLSLENRRTATECAVLNSPPDTTVIVHVGAPATADAVALAQHAARSGAHLVSSLPPVGSYSFEEIKSYYQALAQASELPLMIYYYPSLGPAIRTTEQVLDLCAIPNVMGLKFTDCDFYRLWSIRRSGAAVFAGSDEMLISGLVMGANGGIGSTYNLIADSFVELYRQACAQRWEEARKTQSRINEFIRVLLRYPVQSSIKQILAWTGIDCGNCILPRRELTPSEQVELQAGVLETELGRRLFDKTDGRACPQQG